MRHCICGRNIVSVGKDSNRRKVSATFRSLYETVKWESRSRRHSAVSSYRKKRSLVTALRYGLGGAYVEPFCRVLHVILRGHPCTVL